MPPSDENVQSVPICANVLRVFRNPAYSSTCLPLLVFLSLCLPVQVDRIKNAERPLTITLRRVPWTTLRPTEATVAAPRPAMEAQIPQDHYMLNSEVSAATAQGKSDADLIQDLQNENKKLREALRLSNAENQVGATARNCTVLEMTFHILCLTDDLNSTARLD